MSDFLFPSLDFPGETSLSVSQIAKKLGYCDKHITNLIEDGTLIILDVRRTGRTKRSTRVPIEAYRAFIIKCMSTDEEFARDQFEKAKKSADQLSLALDLHTNNTHE